MLAKYPQIAQREQRAQSCCVFSQSTISNFGESELTLDYPKGMLDLGPNARFDFLEPRGAYSWFFCSQLGQPGRASTLIELACKG